MGELEEDESVGPPLGEHDWSLTFTIHIPQVLRSEAGEFSFEFPEIKAFSHILFGTLTDHAFELIKCDRCDARPHEIVWGERCLGEVKDD